MDMPAQSVAKSHPFEIRQLLFVYAFSFLGAIVLCLFGLIQVFAEHSWLIGIGEIIGGVIFGLNILAHHFFPNALRTKVVMLLNQAAFLMLMLITGGIENTGIFWYFTFPLTAFFLMGRRNGIFWLLGLAVATLSVYVLGATGMISIAYSAVTMRQLFSSVLVVSILVYLYQRAVDLSQVQVEQKEQEVTEAQAVGHVGVFNWKLKTSEVSWSAEAFRLYGLEPKAIPPSQEEYFSLIHPDDEAKARKDLEEALTAKETHESLHRVVWPDGSIHWIRIRSNVVFDQTGKAEEMRGTYQDVTKEHEVDRMKTEFISIASHQLRTPLTAVKWLIELMMGNELEGKLTDAQREVMEKVKTSNEEMIELVDALLNISRIEVGRVAVNLAEVELSTIAREAIAEVLPQLDQKKQTVKVNGPATGFPKLKTDGKLLRQILINFLTNATKFSPTGSTITLSGEPKDQEWVFAINDTGIGIPPLEQKLIFQRFFRAKNVLDQEIDGNGLGLYLNKILATALEGKVSFESQEGKGSTFYISLPIYPTMSHEVSA